MTDRVWYGYIKEAENRAAEEGTGTLPFMVICWDLDSSVRSTMHRRHMIPEIRAGRKTWDDYSLACADDEPIEGSVVLMRMLGRRYLNFAVSGASEAALNLTREWCGKHDVPLDDFLLRPPGDDTPNGEWKVSAVRRLRSAGFDVRLFVEDWEPSARYIREQTGVPVLGINPFDPDTISVTREGLAEALVKVDARTQVRGMEMSARLFAELEKKRGSV